jgi:hypothetical protein
MALHARISIVGIKLQLTYVFFFTSGALGCLLYQILHPEVMPLWSVGRDDNLSEEHSDKKDNLFDLCEWSNALKEEKLSVIQHPQGRNLLSLLLNKDPAKRPTLERILVHCFLSGLPSIRMIGDNPKYSVFLSYRVASNKDIADTLYELLTDEGIDVYLDSKCLKDGEPWEKGFCEGLVDSSIFVPLLSQSAINHPDKEWQNFSKLQEDSRCDNVLLEHRVALELVDIGLIDKILPILIGNSSIPASSSASSSSSSSS